MIHFIDSLTFRKDPWFYFAKTSFENREMLPENCAGYVPSEKRDSAEARKKGLARFLGDLSQELRREPRPKGSSLLEGLENLQGGTVVRGLATDRFVLIRYVKAETPFVDGRAGEYLVKKLPATFYVSLLPFSKGFIVLYWIAEGDAWRIYHVSMPCM